LGSLITLTTDFGLQDGYVGVMKGVILGIAPACQLVDLSHDIAPQQVGAAAFVVYSAYRYFPPSTVHLVVVDPGVGTERRPIAVRTPRGLFVAPDNGVLGYVLDVEEEWDAVHLTERRFWLPAVSQTFHGRDIFAPCAAHLAAGVPLEQLGPSIGDPVLRPLPRPHAIDARRVAGVALYIDRFGNIVTNLPADYRLAGRPAAEWGMALCAVAGSRRACGLLSAYGAAPAGAALLLVGSSGFIEIALAQGNVAAAWDVCVGEPIVFEVHDLTQA